MTVAGEIGDIKETSADTNTQNQMYTPSSQLKASLGQFATPDILTGTYGSIMLRSQLPPEQMADALRAAVHSIDPQLPLTHVETMEHVIAEGQASRRFNTVLISAFAGAAVLLALLGIYSVIAFSAALRTQEVAIRLALGSQRSSVMRLVLTSGAKLGLAGCVLGGVGAVFATRCCGLCCSRSIRWTRCAVPGRSAGPAGPRPVGSFHPADCLGGLGDSRAPRRGH